MKILYIIKVAFKSMNKDIYLINDVDTTGQPSGKTKLTCHLYEYQKTPWNFLKTISKWEKLI